MRVRHKWRGLSPARRAALLPALAVVVIVRMLLRLLPLPMWSRLARWVRKPSPPPAALAPNAAHDVAWAVRRASRIVPGATCLTQAVATQILLSRRGVASQLEIGVARANPHGIRAHAWLVSGESVVIGAGGMSEYAPLLRDRPLGEAFTVGGYITHSSEEVQ